MSKINVLGIDPSLRNFGFAHASIDLETFDVELKRVELASPPTVAKAVKKAVRVNSDDLRRARFLFAALQKNIKGNQIAIVEVPVGSQSARSMASYGICVGVLASCNIPIIEVTPSEVKMSACGDKQATKADMIAWAKATHPNANWLTRKSKGEVVLTNNNEHLADATAAIYAGAVTEQFNMAAALMKGMAA